MGIEQGNVEKLKIAYQTYGMSNLRPDRLLPKLAEIGYEGVEICIGSSYPTAPKKLSASARRDLRSMLISLGLGLPALNLFSCPLTDDPGEYRLQLEKFRAAAQLAQDLNVGEGIPPITTMLHQFPSMPSARSHVVDLRVEEHFQDWQDNREEIAARLTEWGEIAASYDTHLAIEPHIGGILQKPEDAVWLIERIGSPAVRLNFDISHFTAAGYPLEETVTSLAPLAVCTHVKDAHRMNDRVQFMLPGKGDFDYVSYFQAMARAGFQGYITAEVSVHVFSHPNYDPWEAAEFSWKTLSSAREKAKQT